MVCKCVMSIPKEKKRSIKNFPKSLSDVDLGPFSKHGIKQFHYCQILCFEAPQALLEGNSAVGWIQSADDFVYVSILYTLFIWISNDLKALTLCFVLELWDFILTAYTKVWAQVFFV